MSEYNELIERLETAEVREPQKPSGQYITTLGKQAADALRELVAENERLRDGLDRIIDAWDGDNESMHDDPAVIARATLVGEGGNE